MTRTNEPLVSLQELGEAMGYGLPGPAMLKAQSLGFKQNGCVDWRGQPAVPESVARAVLEGICGRPTSCVNVMSSAKRLNSPSCANSSAKRENGAGRIGIAVSGVTCLPVG